LFDFTHCPEVAAKPVLLMNASSMWGCRSWAQLITFGLVWIAYAATYLIRKGRLGDSPGTESF